VDKLIQPIAQQQKSYLKDTTNLINFIEGSKVLPDTTLVALDVTSFYTNIPQEEGIITVCKAYERFHNYNPPIPSLYLKDMLCLILQENSFQFRGNNFFRTHGTVMGTKMPVFVFLILEHIFLNSNTYFRTRIHIFVLELRILYRKKNIYYCTGIYNALTEYIPPYCNINCRTTLVGHRRKLLFV